MSQTAPVPAKRLAVFFDGTDNTSSDNTNVWRAHEMLAAKDAAGHPQLKHYIEGVGTNIGQLAAGSIFGAGIIDRICEGYRWLADHYVEGDAIYVFGFSRGAFAARSLVQLIANCGLPTRNGLATWSPRRAFDRYEKLSQQDTEEIRPLWRLTYWGRHPDKAPAGWMPDRDEQTLMNPGFVQAPQIQMAGLWDTVGAIGKDALENAGARTQKSAAHNVRPTLAQASGYHALAIDEHRPMFDATLWRRFVPAVPLTPKMNYQRYEQRWFVGAHSDVGGGYPDGQLQELSFEWMIGKAIAEGLNFPGVHTASPGAGASDIHDSYSKFAFRILALWDKIRRGDQRHYRVIAKDPRPLTTVTGTPGHLVTINETLDPSVIDRWRHDSTYRPPSLVEYFARHPPASS